jgi:hypothetical protein
MFVFLLIYLMDITLTKLKSLVVYGILKDIVFFPKFGHFKFSNPVNVDDLCLQYADAFVHPPPA